MMSLFGGKKTIVLNICCAFFVVMMDKFSKRMLDFVFASSTYSY